jgi:hypothetical protein
MVTGTGLYYFDGRNLKEFRLPIGKGYNQTGNIALCGRKRTKPVGAVACSKNRWSNMILSINAVSIGFAPGFSLCP